MRPLRLAVMLEQALEVGGGFQQPLNDLLWLRDWAAKSGNEIVVYSPYPKTLDILKEFGVTARLLKFGPLDHVFLFLKYCGPFDLVQIALKLKSPFERALIRDGIDVVHFTSTSKRHLLLYELPFIITIFDGCFRDSPEFDEVREFGQFERRDIVWRSAVTKAAVVVTNADELIDMLCRRYAMERDHAVCIPFSPSLYVSRSATAEQEAEDAAILGKHGIEPGYLFYPAQFWSHKNHATALLAMRLLRDQGQTHRLVLCGSDPGARAAFEALVAQHGLGDCVRMLGFVPNAELGALYRGAHALVMATYFGPTNLPPLEAWAVGTPVIYPEAFQAQAGDAAILFDYDDPASLAKAIARLGSAEERSRLAIAGQQRLAHFAVRIDEGHRQLAKHLSRLRYRRYPQIY